LSAIFVELTAFAARSARFTWPSTMSPDRIVLAAYAEPALSAMTRARVEQKLA
jgi:hypothetical protein